MESFYSRSELRSIGERIAREALTLDGEMRSLHRTALEQLAQLPALARHREELLAILPEEEPEELTAAKAALRGERSSCRRKTRRSRWPPGTRWCSGPGRASHGKSSDWPPWPSSAKRTLSASWAGRRKHLRAMRKHWHAYEEAGRRFGEDDTEVDVEIVASALLNKGITLAQLGRKEEALDACQEVVNRFGECSSPEILESVVAALFCKGVDLAALNRPEEALAAYDEVASRLGESDTGVPSWDPRKIPFSKRGSPSATWIGPRNPWPSTRRWCGDSGRAKPRISSRGSPVPFSTREQHSSSWNDQRKHWPPMRRCSGDSARSRHRTFSKCRL